MGRASRFWLWVLAAGAVVGCGDDRRTIRVTPTAAPAAATATPDASAPPTAPLATATALGTPSGTAATPTGTNAATPTGTPPTGTPPTALPTATPNTSAIGPRISYLGISAADDRPVESTGTDAAGRPIFTRLLGTGLNLIVEGARGADGAAPGNSAFAAEGGEPDLQLLVSRPLGDGSAAVCDFELEGNSGGIPGVDPPLFSNPAATADLMNDLGCRVNDGTGQPVGRNAGQACTRFATGDFSFVEESSVVQFCLPIARAWAFPRGDTIVTARLRSTRGTLGEAVQIVVRIERDPPPTPQPTPTPLVTGSPTRTPHPAQLTFLGVASADDRIQEPDGVDAAGRPIYERLIGHGFSLVVEGAPGVDGRPVGINAFDPDGLPPDLQVLVSRPLGDGSEAVCDFSVDEEIFGGIPGVDPPLFTTDPAVVGAINDLGCRVNDGTGAALGRPRSAACTRTSLGDFAVASELTTVQFCLPIAGAWSFPLGDTIVAARVRSVSGGLSEVGEIVIRVLDDSVPFECAAGGLGLRALTVARPGSGFFVAELEGDVGSDPWLAEPLQLCAGPDAGDGFHSLRLLEDAVLGFPVVDGSIVCAKLFARFSGGVLDCGGIDGHDVIQRLDVISGALTRELGLGGPAPPGSATLSASVAFLNLPAGASTEDCRSQDFGFEVPRIVTTGSSTTLITSSSDPEQPMLSLSGEPFDCAQWTASDGPGALALSLPLLAQPAVNDTAIGLVLDD